MNTANIYDVQASEPYDRTDGKGNPIRYTPAHANLRMHVVTSSVERAIELVRQSHPEAVFHQIIKRSAVTECIVDSEVSA